MAPDDKSTSLTLLERARDRDEEAWARLMRLYAPLVERWCAHCGVCGQDADDVRQDVFHAVAVGLDGFRRERSGDTFRGWLRVITRNKLIDHSRRRARQPEARGGTDAQRQIAQLAEQDLPEDSADDLGGLYRRALELVRAEFEPRTWEAFWRAAIDGQAPDLIAADLGVTPAAVRKAKSRVLHRLRQEVGDLID
ncbi:MAG TPA: RNA polymerase sigma factor [Gemmataceae bacterium]|nr:RNA polymerase sigma factor [Gemmataceae bacterium]